jgi:starch-binding outer membrane protein, SusD/RagB family
MKKNNLVLFFLVSCFILFFLGGCKKFLQEKVYTEYDPSTFTSSESGIESILVGAYAEEAIRSYGARDYIYIMNEFPTDEMNDANGGLYATAALFMQFKWDPTSGVTGGVYSKMYRAIRDANVLLDNIKGVATLSSDKLAEYTAEARFIRAEAYSVLYYSFGPTPLITTAKTIDLKPSRASDDSMKQFITTELIAAAADLPVTAAKLGEATKGAAFGVLCKFYLNTKQWQKSIDIANQIIGLNYYSLFPDITTLFAVQNNHNNEYIYYYPCSTAPAGFGNIVMAHTFPPKYPIQSNWVNYGTDFHIMSSLVNSFDKNDKRLTMIDTSFININGSLVELNTNAQGKPANLSASFKFVPDPNGVGEDMGNYIPMIRYADILLSKAEAMNNLQGPNLESFALIDSIRNRAGLPNLDPSKYNSADALNDEILQEREWEFYGEGLRRQDLIRMGKFISSAQARGIINAQAYQVLYPIPQTEIQSNPNLTQNPGY